MDTKTVTVFMIKNYKGQGTTLLTDEFSLARRYAEDGKEVFVGSAYADPQAACNDVGDWSQLRIQSLRKEKETA